VAQGAGDRRDPPRAAPLGTRRGRHLAGAGPVQTNFVDLGHGHGCGPTPLLGQAAGPRHLLTEPGMGYRYQPQRPRIAVQVRSKRGASAARHGAYMTTTGARTPSTETSASATPASGTTRINPSTWSGYFRYDQAQLRPAPAQLLTLAGQGAIDATGQLQHPGDVAAQLPLAMANVEELLSAAGMDLSDVLHLTIYVTDVDAAVAVYGAVTERLDAVGATPPATLVGVTRLAIPGMVVEIGATAGR